MARITTKNWLDQHLETLPTWQQAAFKSFSAMVADDGNTYPCIPAKLGFISDHLRYCFIGNPLEPQSISELSNHLKDYSKNWHSFGQYTAFVAFFETTELMNNNFDIENYRSLFWSILNDLTAKDDKEWPKEIPTNPSEREWEFCFNGEPFFVFCATPLHQLRKSRYFPNLLLVFQPLAGLKELNHTTVYGRNLRKIIRKRINAYDLIPVHHDLKWYGQEGSYEWKQYFLSDDDSSPQQCPFHKNQNNFFITQQHE